LLAYADFFIVFQILTAFFVGAILWFSLRAYRLTNMSFLIAFFLGFLLLESSFTFVLINRLVGHTGILYHGTFWIQEILQTAAFAFIASAYYFKNKELTNGRIATYAIAMIIIIAISVFAFLSTPPTLAFAWRALTSPYFYLANLALLSYAVYGVATTATTSLSSSHKRPIRARALLVPAGFAILALSQILWIYWGFTDLNDVLVIANALYVTGLALLASALLMILRRRPSYAEVH
jgi:hypothetical protein